MLSLARQRADILHSLDAAKLKALVVAGFPVDDRKVLGGQSSLLGFKTGSTAVVAIAQRTAAPAAAL